MSAVKITSSVKVLLVQGLYIMCLGEGNVLVLTLPLPRVQGLIKIIIFMLATEYMPSMIESLE